MVEATSFGSWKSYLQQDACSALWKKHDDLTAHQVYSGHVSWIAWYGHCDHVSVTMQQFMWELDTVRVAYLVMDYFEYLDAASPSNQP